MKQVYKRLWFQVVMASVAGVVVGLLLAPSGMALLTEEAAERAGPWIALPGNLFLSIIKMVVIPLVLSSIILGITSSGDIGFLKKVSIRIFPYFIGTTMVATTLGALVAIHFCANCGYGRRENMNGSHLDNNRVMFGLQVY
jgi:Na+/H+-dicarboxylate symporter